MMRMWLRVACALWLAGTSGAQARLFAELRGGHLPAVEDFTLSMATGDVDGDGDPDVVLGNQSGARTPGGPMLLENDGRGVFRAAPAGRLPPGSPLTKVVALADVDGDLDLDLVVGSLSSTQLLLNDGRGAFTDVSATHLAGTTDTVSAVVFSDVDADGDADLFLGRGSGLGLQPQLLLNDGSGRFADATASRLPQQPLRVASTVFADVDRDGDEDLVLAVSLVIAPTGPHLQNRLYLNDGTGRFGDATALRMPAYNDQSNAVAAGDLDGDGDLDLVFGNVGADRVYLNNGVGVFSDVSSTALPLGSPNSAAVALIDVDGDGDLDLSIGTLGDADDCRLYVNDGTAVFTDESSLRLPDTAADTSALVALDVEADGDMDLILGNSLAGSQAQMLLVNDGGGRFANATATDLPAEFDTGTTVALADFDRDGDLDAVIGNWGEQNALHLNDGRGHLHDASNLLPPDTERPSHVIAFDADGDGDQDLYWANAQQDQLYLNDGTSRFADATATRLPLLPVVTGGVAAGDVDSDGDPDLVVATARFGGSRNLLLLNNGLGLFTNATAGRMPARWDTTPAVRLADVDGDGDLDAAFANDRSQDRLYLNDGGGVFTDVTATHMPTDQAASLDLEFADVDGDGDPDLVVAGFVSERNRLYLNDGSGVFTDVTAARMPALFHRTTSIAAADFDEDGDIDLLFGNQQIAFSSRTEQNRLYLNDGKGLFIDGSTLLPSDFENATDIAAGDLDADGDVDAVIPNNGVFNRVWRNLRRQIHAPLLPQLGHRYELHVHAWPAVVGNAAMPFVAIAAARLPISGLGVVGLDPRSTVALPPVPLPAATGEAIVAFTVPPLPVWVGTPLYAQAVVLPFRSLPRLTNVVLARAL